MSPADPQTDSAFWEIPAKGFVVRYPLGVFHELDFLVNEGFRRIPHGGVETGGVLWGHREADSVTITTFRPIECEHAAGPSFVLSAADLDRLTDQMRSASADSELAGLEPLGFYVAHTRGALAMNDKDADLFDRFFPESGQVVLLIKPEKFQPTRFAFVFREADGRVDSSSAEHALILPLPGRASGAGMQPVPSIPAPARERPPSIVTPPPAPVAAETPAAAETRVPANVSAQPTGQALAATGGVLPPPMTDLPSAEEIRRRRESRTESWQPANTALAERDATRPRRPSNQVNLGFSGVLVLAALLGCAAGYWAYLQLPAAIIPLAIRKEPSVLWVSWPSQQTRDAAYAAIRVDDGQAVALTSDQKNRGEFELKTAATDVKLELIAQHWLRDSRGIVRFVSGAAQQASQPAPNENAPDTPVASPPASAPQH